MDRANYVETDLHIKGPVHLSQEGASLDDQIALRYTFNEACKLYNDSMSADNVGAKKSFANKCYGFTHK